jgi:hypothetical protein
MGKGLFSISGIELSVSIPRDGFSQSVSYK